MNAVVPTDAPVVAGELPRIDYSRYAVVPIWYYCNSQCTFCMVEKQLGDLPTIDLPTYRALLEGLLAEGRYDGLILSGGEVTTFPGLADYIRTAAELGGFRRIQIQTNARRLARKDLTDRLVDAGLNECFISVHGLEAVQDEITEIAGGFAETWAAIEYLQTLPVNLITNTVLTRTNVGDLLPLFEALAGLRISEMHIWNYFPMAGSDRKNLLVSMRDFYALLPDLLAIVEPLRRPLVLKGFPECLSLGPPGYFDSTFPLNLIDQAFWDNFDENRFGCCPYRAQCSAKRCFGLSAAYVEKFGDERELLVPRR